MPWKVMRQHVRFGPWHTLYAGPELGARVAYRDLFQRRRRCNLVLLRPDGTPELWSPRPAAVVAAQGA